VSTSFREFVSVKGGSEALGLLRFRVWKKGGSTWCVAAASLPLSPLGVLPLPLCPSLHLVCCRCLSAPLSTWCVAAASLPLSRPSSCVVVRARVRVRESVYDFSTLHMHTVGMYV
jgi:hypothetical protein